MMIRSAITTFMLSAIVVSSTEIASAQLIRAPLDRGFGRVASITMTVDEMYGPYKVRPETDPILGPGYPSLFIAEVQIKPVRYRLMDVVDPKTGQTNEELVWYMVYRVIPRDYTELAGDSRDSLVKKLSDPDLVPQNTIDPVEGYPLMLPRFILRTDDSREDRHEYVDEVNAQIQRAVFTREFREDAAHLRLLSSVEAITEVPEPVSVDDPDPLASALYGVAIWRNVDPKTDYFTITMTGFSNAYRISRDAAGELSVEEKVIEQRFGRPGDEFRQRESEFRFIDSASLDRNGDVVVVMDGTAARFPHDQPCPAFVDDLRAELEEDAAKATDGGRPPERTWPVWRYQKRQAEIRMPQFEIILRNPRTDVQAAN